MSDSPHWRTLEDLYQAALHLQPSARAAFLNKACPDETLRREVASLLEARPAGDDLLEHAAIRHFAPLIGPGDQLAHYRIGECIGTGGMGEVYRGTDTKLHREVAIKILPGAFANDAGRLARFQREAKVLAVLNHSNIAQIYGVEESGDVHALVMEMVKGAPLSKPQTLHTALNYARQIAEGLEAAHEKGIVHRDLKPGNIMVTPEGLVKILDFGLASSPSRELEGDLTSSRTATMPATQAGMILGTAAYMSPEQAVGKPVDKRSDIWSFGVVLYEMLSGAGLFNGETTSQTLANVLTKPIDFAELPKETPFTIRTLLSRCLDRDPRTRLRDIGEARILLSNPQAVSSAAAQSPTPRHLVTALAVAASLLFLTATALALRYYLAVPPAARVINSVLLPPDNTEFDFGITFPIPAISPDGTHIVYGARARNGIGQLWVRRLDSSTAKPLPGTENAATPFWSPDSRWVAFGQQSELKKINIQGGPPVSVTGIPGFLRGGSWNEQGIILIGLLSTNPILRVPASGGKAVPATKNEGGAHRYPSFLPDGRHFLYATARGGEMTVQVGSLDQPERAGKVVTQAHSAAAYAQGHLLFIHEHTLMAEAFDVHRLETRGEAIPIAEGVPTFGTLSRVPGFAVSPTGLMVYFSEPSGQTRLVWKDRAGNVLGNLGPPQAGTIDSVELSPDGKKAAVVIFNPQADIWIYDAARGIPARFTFDPKDDSSPVWSPDGKTLYFASNRSGEIDVYRKAASGAGADEQLLADSQDKSPYSLSEDGKLLLYSRSAEKTGFDLWTLPVTLAPGGHREPRVFLQTPFTEWRGRFSPNGAWVTYESNESGEFQVYAAPFPGPGGKRQISLSGGFSARWRRDGKEIFYVTPNGQLMAVEVGDKSGTLEVGPARNLFSPKFLTF